MIKIRLLSILPQSKKHIAGNIFWQWMGLLVQIRLIASLVHLFGNCLEERWDRADLLHTVVILVVCVLIRGVCDRESSRQSYLAGADVKRVLRQKIYDKLLCMGGNYKEKVNTSNVVQMMTEGVEQLEIYFSKYVPQLIYSMLAPLTLFFCLCRISMKTSVVLLVCVPFIPLSIALVQTYAKKLLKKYWSAYEGLGDSFLENLQGLTTLKIYQTDGKAAEQMDVEAQHFRRITMKVLTMQLNSTSIMDIMAYGGAAVGIFTAMTELARGQITIMQTLLFVLLAAEFFLPLRVLGSFFHIAMNGMAASDNIFALLDTGVEADGKEDIISQKCVQISAEHVSFAYDKKKVLDDISFDVKAGECISLVGKSGCGKSTIVSLLTKRHRGYTGKILINGTDLTKIAEHSLHRHVTTVSCGSYLFHEMVKEHLRMAKPDATEDEMIMVLRKVNMWEELKKKGGLHAVIEEHGGNFSGGQLQRLAIARALLHDSEVYIFDEATSNIDVESEEIIMDVIKELAQTKAVILISHRLSNVVESTRIYMMEHGRIKEMGSHKDLMSVSITDRKDTGVYRTLYLSQKELEEYGQIIPEG